MNALVPYIEAGLFLTVDVFFAERAKALCPGATEETDIFLAFLFALSRQGHLAFPLEKTEELARALPSKHPISLQELVYKVKMGARHLPPSFGEFLCESDGVFYLQKNWKCEQDIARHVSRLMHSSLSPLSIDMEEISSLNTEQKTAIAAASQSPVSLLFGGPGTGKTYTAARLIQAFLAADEKKQMRVFVAAPTGKAVAQLDAYLRRFLPEETRVHTGTLHALLGLRKESTREQEPVVFFADLIIVDECSMIDASLFVSLLSAILEGSRLVLIGDPHQLPSVEAGSVFADLIAAIDEGFSLPATRLHVCLRSEREEILQFSEKVRTGNSLQAIEMLAGKDVRHAGFDLEGDRLKAYDSLFNIYQKVFPSFFPQEPNPSELLCHLDAFRLLSCMRQGDFGVDAINHLFSERFFEQALKNQWWAVPILVTRSDYALHLYNGDTGVLMRRVHSSLALTQEDYAYFPERKCEGGFRKIPALALPSFELGYCLSVHKSQGSEYDEIFILVPPGSEVFGREILYTAATRAKRAITCAGSLDVIEKVIQNSARKLSGLSARLKENIGTI